MIILISTVYLGSSPSWDRVACANKTASYAGYRLDYQPLFGKMSPRGGT